MSLKLVILGDACVGKSCLINKFTTNQFREFEEPTIGAAFQAVRVSDTYPTLEVWDTAGQERFRSLAPMYYRDAKVAFICYDITNKESFESAKYWYNQIAEKGDNDCIKILVATKSDLYAQREVEVVERYLKSANVSYFMETSAKTGKNIDKLFNLAVREGSLVYRRGESRGNRKGGLKRRKKDRGGRICSNWERLGKEADEEKIFGNNCC
jgi:small GTP-binding protein